MQVAAGVHLRAAFDAGIGCPARTTTSISTDVGSSRRHGNPYRGCENSTLDGDSGHEPGQHALRRREGVVLGVLVAPPV